MATEKLSIGSLKDAEKAVAELSQLVDSLKVLELAKSLSAAEHDKAFLARHKRQPAEVDKRISALQKAVSKWAVADQKKNVSGWKGKSVELLSGVISLAISPGKVALIKKVAKNFDEATGLMAKVSKLRCFIRNPAPMMDKEAILAAYTDKKITNEQLEKAGLKVEKPTTVTIAFKEL